MAFLSEPQPFHKFRVSPQARARGPREGAAEPTFQPTPSLPVAGGVRLERALPPAAWPPPDDPCWELIGAPREEIARLHASVAGRLEFIGLHSYVEARSAIDVSFPVPRIIAFCANEHDVRTCLEFARAKEWPFAVRSGGHNGAGYHLCSGLVIDVQNLDDIRRDGESVSVGAGVRWGALGAELDKYGLYLPGGTCPTVSVSGYTMGGGYSVASRSVGLACDRLKSLKVLSASGEVLIAEREGQHRDLFWAMAGGGGGQFGVLLEATFQALSENRFVGFALNWPLSDAPEVLRLLEANYTGPEHARLGYLMALTTLVAAKKNPDDPNETTQAEGRMSLSVLGLFRGSFGELETTIAPLLRVGSGGKWRFRAEGSYNQMNSAIFGVLPFRALGLARATKLEVTGYVERSKSLDWAALVAQLERAENPGNLIAFEPYGGAVAQPNDASSFPHRSQRLNLKINSYYRADWTYNKTRASAQTWLDSVASIARPALSGRVYVNYQRDGLRDYRSAYWAQNLEQLQAIQHKYDPLGFFRSPQPLRP